MTLQEAIDLLREQQERCTTARGWDAFEMVIDAARCEEARRKHFRKKD